MGPLLFDLPSQHFPELTAWICKKSVGSELFITWVTQGKTFNHSKSQFPPLQNDDKSCLIKLYRELTEIIKRLTMEDQ